MKYSHQAPSNIALVKYWGKHGRQLPRNPNASFTLSTARTITTLEAQPRDVNNPAAIQVTLLYDGVEHPAFAKRITQYFTAVADEFPVLRAHAFTIHTTNTFPHGAGIASSASAMAALACCVVELEGDDSLSEAERLQRTSHLARLGSGSAARSVFAKAAAWGASPDLPGSSDAYAVPLAERLAPVFHDYQDTILLVSEAEKSVSSSAGHALMEQHPYAETRYALARRRFVRLLDILRRGELDDFCTLVEADALDLHALMMQSTPPYLLIEPATLAIVEAVRHFRKTSGLPVCFTLDAGPNVHLLYPRSITTEVGAWLAEEVAPLMPGRSLDGKVIYDHVGEGASRID